ncbi:MAG: DUF814 domain-containing protein, partial [Deinococcus sp.]|nr:DUF814 domain-containing protein [Deinococcus sp.]
PGTTSLTVPDLFSGTGEVTIPLDPTKGLAENAQTHYQRAQKRRRALVGLDQRERSHQAELARKQAALAQVPLADAVRLQALLPRQRGKKGERRTPGLSFRSRQGFAILVGRSSQENDQLTMRIAKSQDVWLHVQATPGSHVIVRAAGKQVPFETILEAARLAAYYSQARHSSNVPVDYTLRKHVWKPRGAKPGAVLITQQKTVYVNPAPPSSSAELLSSET